MSTTSHLETRQIAVDIRRNGDRFRDFLVHHGGSLILLMLAVACASPLGDIVNARGLFRMAIGVQILGIGAMGEERGP